MPTTNPGTGHGQMTGLCGGTATVIPHPMPPEDGADPNRYMILVLQDTG